MRARLTLNNVNDESMKENSVAKNGAEGCESK